MSDEHRQRASALEGLMRTDAWALVVEHLAERREKALRNMTHRDASPEERLWGAAAWTEAGELMDWPARESEFCRRQLERESVSA